MKQLAFSLEEYKERTQKVKTEMESRGIEVLIVAQPCNMYWVSGYDSLSYYVPQVTVVSTDSDEPFVIVRFQDKYAAEVTTWLSEENIYSYPDKYLWDPDTLYVYDYIADILKEKGLAKKKIGVESFAYYYTHYQHVCLEKALPDATFIDASKLVNWTRGPKSQKELDYMHIAARITERAMHNALDTVNDGVRENLVGANIMRDLSLGNAAYGGEISALPPIIASGDRTQAAHFTYRTEGCFEKNTHSYLEISGTYKRYHSPMSRTIYIGKPSDEIKKVSEVVVEGLGAALAKIKTGTACEDVERAWQTTINRYGYEKESRMGYAVGCAYAPVWAEDTAYFRPGEKFALRENMTFHVMPGIWLEGFGLAITETVRVTDKGCETITKFPRHLFVAD